MLEERQEELINSVLEDDKEKIHEITDNMYPIDIAIIIEEFDDESLMKFNEHIDNELMAEIIEQASEELQVRIIKLFEFKSIVHLFSYMSNDDIADILGNLPIKMRKDLLKLMKTGDTRQLQELLGYDEDSALKPYLC